MTKKRIEKEIAELRAMTTEELAARYAEVWNKPTHVLHREWLWKRCAWKLQERRHGGLSKAARRRLDALIAEIDLPADEDQRTVTGALRRSGNGRAKAGAPRPGTTLVRTWRGREITATVLDHGIEVDGEVHRSLTAAAKAVTGSHWNGRLFWGVTKRRAAR